MGGYTTPKLSSRNQEINSRDRGRGGARVFCSSSCLAGSFGFGGATVPSFLSRDAAVICHVVGGERLRCICNFTRHSPPPSPSPPFLLDLFPTENTQLRCPSSLRPSPSPSHPSPFPKTRHDPPRNSRSFGEERERGRGGRGGGRRWPNYSGPQMIVSASFRRLRRHHPEYARLNESVTKTPGETVRFY